MLAVKPFVARQYGTARQVSLDASQYTEVEEHSVVPHWQVAAMLAVNPSVALQYGTARQVLMD